LGFDVCIPVIYFRIEAHNTFSVCGIKFGKNKIPLLIFFCCLILCQHVHLRVCIITIFHFILLLQFIKCTEHFFSLCGIFCLVLCQHVHWKICIITIFHFILLLQFMKCTPQYQQNTIQSLTIYIHYSSLTNSKKKAEKIRGGPNKQRLG